MDDPKILAADIVRGDCACRDSADVTSPHPGTRRHRLRVQVHLYGRHAGAGGDHEMYHNKNPLRFPCVSIFFAI
eukprot:SAG25_NODE_12685_length_276_cov_1.135593_1_plen_73_part_10